MKPENLATRASSLISRISFDVSQYATRAIGQVRRNAVNTFWYRGRVNFGDLLTRELLNSFGYTTVYSPIDKCECVAIGSILQVLPESYTGVILGSGLIREEVRQFPHAKILAVRGAITRDLIGAPPSTVLGDPGLLSRRLLPEPPRKSAALGIIPHYEDKRDERIQALVARFGNEAKLIDVERAPSAVLRDIASCEHVISSSLHGVICADALGVSNAWIQLSDRVVGGGFKFADYASSIGRSMIPHAVSGHESLSEILVWTKKPIAKVEDVASSLEVAFESTHQFLRRMYRS